VPIIALIHPDNRVERVEAQIGGSAMRAAVLHGVDGTVAECGGNAFCGTCHV
jgi:2Fe-2S ferredoxin